MFVPKALRVRAAPAISKLLKAESCAIGSQKLFSRGFRSDLFGTDHWGDQKRFKDQFIDIRAREYTHPKKEAVKVAVTGAAGNIGYALLFRLASGEMLGPDQPIYIHAVELPFAMEQLKGVVMELKDCAFPLLKGIVSTDDPEQGFDDIDYALLVGSKPRGPGMERGDLLKDNGHIFKTLGGVLNNQAKPTCKVTVVGNPANTNCMIAAANAPNIPDENFSSMMRLDHDRGLSQIADKAGCPVTDITEFVVWGNHSATQFPDIGQTRIHGANAREVLGFEDYDRWWAEELVPSVQQRGAEVIAARGSSSAASAANACIAQTRDWALGNDGRWVSMGIKSEGQYDIPKDIWYSFPLEVQPGQYAVVEDLPISEYQNEMMQKTAQELLSERDAVSEML